MKLAISNALLLPLPSKYSEKKISISPPELPLLVVVSQSWLLKSDSFPEASLALTVKQ